MHEGDFGFGDLLLVLSSIEFDQLLGDVVKPVHVDVWVPDRLARASISGAHLRGVVADLWQLNFLFE